MKLLNTLAKSKAYHESEQPDLRVLRSVLQTSPWRNYTPHTNGICENTTIRELTFLWRQPLRRQWVIGEDESGDQRNHESNHTVDVLAKNFRWGQFIARHRLTPAR